ncbi:molecular chaperone (plasmid) [Serratia nevei]|uniref:fimbrial biogenesis chaperone n=1 Tax=Serratia nevei TaxID=2703794 RepID=UPI003F6C2A3E
MKMMLVLAPLMVMATSVQAASLQVSPTTVRFNADGKAERVWLSASGDTPVTGQVRVYRWEQKDGKDVLTPTRDVVASPPIMTVPAGQTQLLRLVNKVPAVKREQTYRLIVDELPHAGEKQPHAGVQLLLKYSIPVFVAPAGKTQDNAKRALDGVTFTLQHEGKQTWLAADNTRTTHIRLTKLTYVTKSGQVQVLNAGLLGYVLAGSRQRWAVATPTVAGDYQAIVNDDAASETLLSWPR